MENSKKLEKTKFDNKNTLLYKTAYNLGTLTKYLYEEDDEYKDILSLIDIKKPFDEIFTLIREKIPLFSVYVFIFIYILMSVNFVNQNPYEEENAKNTDEENDIKDSKKKIKTEEKITKEIIKKHFKNINTFLEGLDNNVKTFENRHVLKDLYYQWYNVTFTNEENNDKIILDKIIDAQNILDKIDPIVLEHIEINEKILTFKITDQLENKINILDGIEIFNTAVPSRTIPLIKYTNNYNETYTKIYNSDEEITNSSKNNDPSLPINNNDNSIFLDQLYMSTSQDNNLNTLVLLICTFNTVDKPVFKIATLKLIDQVILISVSSKKTFKKKKKSFVEENDDEENNNEEEGINKDNEKNILAIRKSIPYVKFGDTQESKLKGFFTVKDLIVSKHILHYLIVTNTIFSTYLYVDENAKAFANKKNVYHINYRNFSLKDEQLKDDTIFSKQSITVSFENIKDDNEFIEQEFEINESGEAKDVTSLAIVRINFIKADSPQTLIQFIEIFTRLLRLYMEDLNKTENFFDKYIPESSKFKEVVVNTAKRSKEKSESKYHNLLAKSPLTFLTGKGKEGYPKLATCEIQPLIIKDEEIDDWENLLISKGNTKIKREILKYNEVDQDNNETGVILNIVCPGNKAPYPHKIRYTRENKKEGFYPKCMKTATYKTKAEKKIANKNYNVGAYKIISGATIQGILHTLIVDLLRSNIKFENKDSNLNDFIRLGMNKSNSSIIHCILTAITGEMHNKYIKYDSYADKEKYVNKLRKKISEKIIPEIYKQELYDYSNERILENIADPNVILDPYLYYRGLEEFFNINIFVFNSGKVENVASDPRFEIPRTKLTHIRIVKNYRPSVLVFKHFIMKSKNVIDIHCELIVSKGKIINNTPEEEIEKSSSGRKIAKIKISNEKNEYSSKGEIIFGKEMTKKLFSIMFKIIKTYIINYSEELVEEIIDDDNEDETINLIEKIQGQINIRDSPLGIINWENLFNNDNGFEIIGQKIDFYGKMCCILVEKQDEDKTKFTVIIPPSQPILIKEFNEYVYQTNETIIDTFGKSIKISSGGLWYSVLDIENGIFILSSKSSEGNYSFNKTSPSSPSSPSSPGRSPSSPGKSPSSPGRSPSSPGRSSSNKTSSNKSPSPSSPSPSSPGRSSSSNKTPSSPSPSSSIKKENIPQEEDKNRIVDSLISGSWEFKNRTNDNDQLLTNIISLRNTKKDISIMMQLINWIWKTSIIENGKLLPISKFLKKYVHLDNSSKMKNNDGSYIRYSNLLSRKLKTCNSIKESFLYIENWWEPYFRYASDENKNSDNSSDEEDEEEKNVNNKYSKNLNNSSDEEEEKGRKKVDKKGSKTLNNSSDEEEEKRRGKKTKKHFKNSKTSSQSLSYGIYLYKELYNNVVSYFTKEYSLINGLSNDNFFNLVITRLDDYYLYEEDFNKIPNSIIFLSNHLLKKWVNSMKENFIKTSVLVINKLSIDLYNNLEPIIFNDTNTNKIYLIQNIEEGDILRALNLCMIWKKTFINTGISTKVLDIPLENVPYIVYGISKTQTMIPIENEINDNTDENGYFYQILKFSSETEKYAALLPIL